jgi:hypothetical protein
MHDLLLDLWQDLRDKRMWPIAAALALALLAIPVVLAKPASSPKPSAAPTAPVQTRDPLNAVKVQLAEIQEGKGSALDHFQKKNPFLPPSKLMKQLKGAASATAGTSATASAGSSPASGGGAATGAGGASGGGAPPPLVPLTGSPGGRRGTTRVIKYTYVADVTLWTNGRRRAYHGIHRLRMLPSEQSPFLLFLGVDASGDNAAFLVDSTLTASGEGRCTPSGNDCAVVSLGPGSEEDFRTSDGQSLTLRIDEIRRVRLSHRARGSHSARSRHSHRPRAQAAPVTRRFVVPALTDLVTVARADGPTSSSSAGSR